MVVKTVKLAAINYQNRSSGDAELHFRFFSLWLWSPTGNVRQPDGRGCCSVGTGQSLPRRENVEALGGALGRNDGLDGTARTFLFFRLLQEFGASHFPSWADFHVPSLLSICPPHCCRTFTNP